MITDYTILAYNTTIELRRAVKDYIADGWEPCGGIGVSFVRNESADTEEYPMTLYQAMIRNHVVTK